MWWQVTSFHMLQLHVLILSLPEIEQVQGVYDDDDDDDGGGGDDDDEDHNDGDISTICKRERG